MAVQVVLPMPAWQCTPPLSAFCHWMRPFASSLSRSAPRQHTLVADTLPQLPATRTPPSVVDVIESACSDAVGLPLASKLLKQRCQTTPPLASSLTTRTPWPHPCGYWHWVGALNSPAAT